MDWSHCLIFHFAALLWSFLPVLQCLANGNFHHWRNKPYSQTGSLDILESVPDAFPAQFRIQFKALLRNATHHKNNTQSRRPEPAALRSSNGLVKNATIYIRKSAAPVGEPGEISHGNDFENRGKKSRYGGAPKFITENEVLQPEAYDRDDLYQRQNYDRCIVLDLAATLPTGHSTRIRYVDPQSLNEIRPPPTYEMSKMFPYWWQYRHSAGKPSDYTKANKAASLCSRSPTSDSGLTQVCQSSGKLRYRTYDGSCNNLLYGQWGSADSRYSRLTKPRYADGLDKPRQFSSFSGPYGYRAHPLPNPRTLSRSMSQSVPIPHRVANVLLPYFGQTVAHDLAFTSSHQINQRDADCCVQNAYCTEPECFQFSIPRDDPLYAFFNLTCHQFARSVPSANPDCERTNGPTVREQKSKVTHWLDASFLYGNSEEQNEAVRNLYAGQLAFRNVEKGIHNLQNTEVHKQIPPSAAASDGQNFASSCPHASRKSPGRACFYAADERVNQQPLATAIHTIFLRFHNLVAGSIAQSSPHWSDEMIFQEARKIVIAVYQIIIYKEFLPALLGSGVAESRLYRDAGLKLFDMAHFEGYDPELDPHVLNEFATAGFRLHTLVDDYVPRLLLVTGLAENSLLSTQYNNQTLLYEEGNADALISGMLEEMALAFDPQISEELQGRLFRGQDPIGLDLMAISIQRGRDHGLGTYNDAREACGYGRAVGFEGLRDFVPAHHIHLLQSVYRDVEDIDLMVGGLTEDPVSEDASVGPTFGCIISAEFRTKRAADRFWHENPDQFSLTQLRYLRRVTIPSLLCQTTGLRYIPANAFFIVSQMNPLVPCSTVTDFDVDFYLSLPGRPNDKNE